MFFYIFLLLLDRLLYLLLPWTDGRLQPPPFPTATPLPAATPLPRRRRPHLPALRRGGHQAGGSKLRGLQSTGRLSDVLSRVLPEFPAT